MLQMHTMMHQAGCFTSNRGLIRHISVLHGCGALEKQWGHSKSCATVTWWRCCCCEEITFVSLRYDSKATWRTGCIIAGGIGCHTSSSSAALMFLLTAPCTMDNCFTSFHSASSRLCTTFAPSPKAEQSSSAATL